MAAIGCSWRETSPGVFSARIPPSLRRHFRDQEMLRVVFDPEVWQQDKRSELAAPGGPFLDGLERALAERAGQPIRVAGVITSDGALGSAWSTRVRVLNADVERLDLRISFDEALRFVFEVELPLSPPVTELVTVACDLEGRVLTGRDLAQRDPPEAYDYDELAGAIPLQVEWPGARIESLRQHCRTEAERRVRLAFAPELRARAERGAAQIEEARRAHVQEMREATSELEHTDLEEEFQRRTAVYAASAGGAIRVRERTVTLLVTGRESLLARYRRRDGAMAEIAPKMSLGRVRDDQCAHCKEVRTDYILARERPGLWCSVCGHACAATDCPGTMRVGTVTCPQCVQIRWCPSHVSMCSTCQAIRCPDHGAACEACGRTLCERHVQRHSLSGEVLCAEHGRACAVDGALVRDSELVACSVSGAAVCPQHRAQVDVPAGAVIRSDRVRVCSASGSTMDVSQAAECSVDGKTYLASLLVECPLTHQWMYPGNAVSSLGDERFLHPSAVVASTESGMLVAKDRVVIDAFVRDAVLHPSEAVRCELTGRWTALRRAARATCCNRVVARTLVSVHSVSGELLCIDHAGQCAVDRAVFRAEELRPCVVTGVRVCATHGATLDDPHGAFVLRQRVRTCSETGQAIDQAAAGVCSVDGKTYKAALLADCPLTGKRFHPKHGVRPEGDPRLLHPSAVVRSTVSGKPVARDRAILDAFAGRQSFLHPSEAVRCELSNQWTALERTVITPCCGKRVALSRTAPSAASGRAVCNGCARDCADGHGPFLPSEVAPCQLSGKLWCSAHLLRAACGLRVGPDRAIRLLDGTWECTDHYRLCGPGGHAVPANELAVSFQSGVECCPQHRAVCECHGAVLGAGEFVVDPYSGAAWCPEWVARCGRCRELAPAAGTGGLCRWCASPVPLEQADPYLVGVYRTQIVPRLSWYTVRLKVGVTGTTQLAWFEVGTLTGGQVRFRLSGGEVEVMPAPGGRRGG